MITIKQLLDQFNINLDLPDHILKLNFYGNYTKCDIIDDDPDFPNEIIHVLIDEEKGYAISIAQPDVEDASLEFWDGYAPDIECDSEWEESYPYDDETIPAHYINN